jgi:NADH-quinone oxidoreductase subunit J
MYLTYTISKKLTNNSFISYNDARIFSRNLEEFKIGVFMTEIVFYVFTGLILLGAINVVVNRNPVHSALSLIFCFISSALLWMHLNTILSLFLIVIYVGAVMVLFLFIIMMLDIKSEVLVKRKWHNVRFAFLMAFMMLGEMIVLIIEKPISIPVRHGGNVTNVADGGVYALSYVLYTNYNYAIELTSIILLLGLIIAVVLNKHKKRVMHSKYQNIREQLKATKSDRLTMLDLN